jgi:hypothetical protein
VKVYWRLGKKDLTDKRYWNSIYNHSGASNQGNGDSKKKLFASCLVKKYPLTLPAIIPKLFFGTFVLIICPKLKVSKY